jgi:hypothetical protein
MGIAQGLRWSDVLFHLVLLCFCIGSFRLNMNLGRKQAKWVGNVSKILMERKLNSFEFVLVPDGKPVGPRMFAALQRHVSRKRNRVVNEHGPIIAILDLHVAVTPADALD